MRLKKASVLTSFAVVDTAHSRCTPTTAPVTNNPKFFAIIGPSNALSSAAAGCPGLKSFTLSTPPPTKNWDKPHKNGAVCPPCAGSFIGVCRTVRAIQPSCWSRTFAATKTALLRAVAALFTRSILKALTRVPLSAQWKISSLVARFVQFYVVE